MKPATMSNINSSLVIIYGSVSKNELCFRKETFLLRSEQSIELIPKFSPLNVVVNKQTGLWKNCKKPVTLNIINFFILIFPVGLCDLVVRVLGNRSGGPGSIPGTTRKKVVGLERGPLSLVITTEELLERKSSGSGLDSRDYGRRDPSR
jgi:hypothetical protein